ncbi:MAG: hypothetical protein HRT57_16610 [Crocinitomicaceae bacterium]|nr:hypothetical protein [Crocinitomicaceae bacterium]
MFNSNYELILPVIYDDFKRHYPTYHGEGDRPPIGVLDGVYIKEYSAFFELKLGGKYGRADTTAKVIIPPIYDKVISKREAFNCHNSKIFL